MGKQKQGRKADVYRLSIVDDNTHESIRAWRVTRPRLISTIVAAVAAALLLMWCILAFTPLRTFIPGYPDSQSKKVAVQNAMKIDSLESAITRWSLYAENLSRVLSGEESFSYDSLISRTSAAYLSGKSAEELAAREQTLRETVREEEQFGVGGNPERSLPIEGMHFFTPLKGVVSKGFDRALHTGVDVTAPTGAVVSAVLDGNAVFAGWDDEAGYILILQHKDNVISVYQHSQKLLVKAGDNVSAGSPVALVGGTGSKTGAEHLHFELWQAGQPLNPQDYISF